MKKAWHSSSEEHRCFAAGAVQTAAAASSKALCSKKTMRACVVTRSATSIVAQAFALAQLKWLLVTIKLHTAPFQYWHDGSEALMVLAPPWLLGASRRAEPPLNKEFVIVVPLYLEECGVTSSI